MPGLVIHQSNRVEELASALAREIEGYNRDPLSPATIVVQSRGMERWLCIELARSMGQLANTRSPFPNNILGDIFAAVMSDAEQSKLFSAEAMTFRAMQTLRDCLQDECFAPLQEYISKSDNDLRRFQLCRKIAGMYDQLATFRPEQIWAWERGDFDSWHGVLWHRMFDDQERQRHRPALFQHFIQRIQDWQGPLPGFTEKLFIFGISTLPRLHLEVLTAVARHIDVHLFLMNPCQEFWHDIASDKLQLKLARKAGTGQNELPRELHFERGHPLLASLGTLSQEFLNLLGDYNPQIIDLFKQPGRDTALTALQSQILELDDPALADRRPLDPKDRSIQLHSCHSPVREVEVLRDELLALMDNNPELQPRDILVMAPDIESYAPYVAAVFDGETLEKQKIPFSIADRSRQKESPLAEAFLKVLALKGARLTASQVFELLEEPAIRKRYGLVVDDLDLIRQWVSETHTRWGIDGAFKERFELPASAANTWQAGFDRLFLGYALPAEEQALFAGILPYDGVEGSASKLLGNFYNFCEQLFACIKAFGQARSLSEWAEFLTLQVEQLFRSETESELVTLLRQLQNLQQLESLTGYNEQIDFDVLRSMLAGELSQPSSSGFLRGGVTFCSLLPMRSIPFKVVALLGMNDAAFPRQSPAVSFDLMSQEPQKGDPSRRQEDRYLFLEAILSAREALFISYLGQSVKDNSEAPPSVVVCELLDLLEQSFEPAAGTLRKQIVTRHRLQGFNPAYFSGEQGLFSYSHDNYQGALALVEQSCSQGWKATAQPFMQSGLAASDDRPTTVSLVQLIKFLQNPSQYFLRNRLGIYIDQNEQALTDQEPFNLDGLANYQISQELVEKLLAGEKTNDLLALYQAKSVLPQGNLAAPTFDKCLASARDFVGKLQKFTQGIEAETITFDQTFGQTRLVGELPGLYPQGLLNQRCASIKPKDRLSAWVRHLAICAISERAGHGSTCSHLLGNSNADLVYQPVIESSKYLQELLLLYHAGQLKPLPFFPKAAFAYCGELRKGKTEEQCLGKARSEWLGNDRSMGENTDADFEYCFGRIDPIDGAFADCAGRIVTPLLNHEAKV